MSDRQDLVETICNLKDELERNVECMERLLILLRDDKPIERVHRELCELTEHIEKKSRVENFWVRGRYAQMYGKRVE